MTDPTSPDERVSASTKPAAAYTHGQVHRIYLALQEAAGIQLPPDTRNVLLHLRRALRPIAVSLEDEQAAVFKRYANGSPTVPPEQRADYINELSALQVTPVTDLRLPEGLPLPLDTLEVRGFTFTLGAVEALLEARIVSWAADGKGG